MSQASFVSKSGVDRKSGYTLHVEGHLDEAWVVCLGVTSLTHQEDTTTALYGVVDQSALYGLLRKIRDAGLVLVLVMRVDAEQPDKGEQDEQ